jgi:hypothetical protein
MGPVDVRAMWADGRGFNSTRPDDPRSHFIYAANYHALEIFVWTGSWLPMVSQRSSVGTLPL